ncbi:MAG: AbgT family transporter, partial [Deltaproteobacteria bacterium]|nr:AbgT family transporter [Deltaproteobacteria bacterium]
MRERLEAIGRAANRALGRSLDVIEAVGNRLPHPATLFAILAVAVAVVSWIGRATGLSAVHPVDGSLIEVRSLLDGAGLRWIYLNVTRNFVEFPPLGYVLAVMVGIGVAEGSGLFSVLIRALVLGAPRRLVTLAIVLAGVVSHLASEAGYVVLIPLGAMVFHALGRHPMAGLAAAFCGVSGGFGANFLIGSVDPILAGLSTSAARILDPSVSVSPAVNFYFMFVSAILVVLVGTWVTESVVEPRLGAYRGAAERVTVGKLDAAERRGLRWAGIALLVTLLLLAAAVLPPGAFLRHPETGSILHSPFLDGLITAVLVFFLIPGLAYGIAVGTVRGDKDAVRHMPP